MRGRIRAPFLAGSAETNGILNLRRAMLLSRGDPTIFLTRPISAGMLLAAVLLIVIITLPNIRAKREEAFQEEAA